MTNGNRALRRWAALLVMGLLGAGVATPVLAVGGAFTDDDTSVHEADIEYIADLGVTTGCNPPTNDLFCPEDNVTRGQMAAFLVRTLELPGVAEDFFTDDDTSVFQRQHQQFGGVGDHPGMCRHGVLSGGQCHSWSDGGVFGAGVWVDRSGQRRFCR